MNIFTTSKCPVESAISLCDTLCTKMVLESAQLLCTAHYVLDGIQKPYKPTHINHPCSIFTRTSKANYMWLYEHFRALCEEYEYRTGKVHKTSELLETLSVPPVNAPDKDLSIDFLCIPDEYKQTLDIHRNYQLYLISKLKGWAVRTDKRQIHVSWTNRNPPKWWIEVN